MQKEYSGKPVFGGIAIGRITIYRRKDSVVKREKVTDVEAEVQRYHKASDDAKEQLQKLHDKALKEVGEANAAVFEVHQMMLDDLDYQESVENIIRTQNVNAEFAVATTGDNFSEMFANMDDDYMRGRAADVKDISNRVVGILSGAGASGFTATEPSILLADDLAPSETVQLDKSLVLSFVTRFGSTNSHTAILARTMNIPALIGVDFSEDGVEGHMGIVDGYEGRFIIDPDDDVLAEYQQKKAKEEEKQRLLQELKGKPNITKDGHEINVFANIGSVKDVADVLANDAGGIGLFRSEFLYLGCDDYPSEEDQFKAYKTVAENMAGKKVVEIPSSKMKVAITKILCEKGYILSYKVVEGQPFNTIKIALKYHPQTKVAAIKGIDRISKPGLRQYVDVDSMPRVLNGLGVAILTTSKGVITDKEARELNVGGEVLCYVY